MKVNIKNIIVSAPVFTVGEIVLLFESFLKRQGICDKIDELTDEVIEKHFQYTREIELLSSGEMGEIPKSIQEKVMIGYLSTIVGSLIHIK